jgi:hypothetical protein
MVSEPESCACIHLIFRIEATNTCDCERVTRARVDSWLAGRREFEELEPPDLSAAVTRSDTLRAEIEPVVDSSL